MKSAVETAAAAAAMTGARKPLEAFTAAQLVAFTKLRHASGNGERAVMLYVHAKQQARSTAHTFQSPMHAVCPVLHMHNKKRSGPFMHTLTILA